MNEGKSGITLAIKAAMMSIVITVALIVVMSNDDITKHINKYIVPLDQALLDVTGIDMGIDRHNIVIEGMGMEFETSDNIRHIITNANNLKHLEQGFYISDDNVLYIRYDIMDDDTRLMSLDNKFGDFNTTTVVFDNKGRKYTYIINQSRYSQSITQTPLLNYDGSPEIIDCKEIVYTDLPWYDGLGRKTYRTAE